jgi:beta-1,4-mannosyltransferase
MTGLTVGQTIRVASVPCDQIYIRHLESWEEPQGVTVHRLEDPVPLTGPHSVEALWWPPAMLAPRWVEENHEGFDIMHIHFGFDSLDPVMMEALVTSLRRYGKPLVYTVHDLINPHQVNAQAHRALLDVLIPAADYLITLTDGAAAEIQAVWGVTAHVLPHPHVADFPTMERLRAARSMDWSENVTTVRRVGVHLKGLRANIDPGIIDPLARVTAALPSTILQINIHRQVLDPAHADYRPVLTEKLLRGAEKGHWELHSHEYFTETELFDYLASLDVCLLPYRFGTHSGWLEAALDVGTPVIVPECGHYRDQHASVVQYRLGADGADEASLWGAVQAQLGKKGPVGLSASERQQQRRFLAQAHREIYASLLAGQGSRISS